jgi:hypothetical protein
MLILKKPLSYFPGPFRHYKEHHYAKEHVEIAKEQLQTHKYLDKERYYDLIL